MLTIPASIQALFKTDLTRKNFRVHFPGGELPDITNGNVVYESVKFTESLCSQEVLKFGLTEASMIEFETVGISNMYGMTIECGIEIDTSSLSAGDIAAIESDPGDGVLVKAADSDIGYGYYRVPYGVFRVDSCPRNQQAMTHRQVKGYSLMGGATFQNSPVELAKLRGSVTKQGNYTPSVPLLAYAAIGWWSPSFVADFPKTSIAWVSGTDTTRTVTLYNDHSITATLEYRFREFTLTDALYSFAADYDTDGITTGLDWIKSTVDAYGGNGAAVSKSAERLIKASVGGYSVFGNIPVFYPYYVQNLALRVPYNALVRVTHPIPGGGSGTATQQIDPLNSTPSIYRLTPSYTDIRASFAPTSEDTTLIPTWKFIDAYDITDLLNGWLELYGQFGLPNRNGGLDIVELENTAPIAIGPGDTDELWWDEYDVSPVGTVRYSFGSNGGENVIEYPIGDGASVYDMTDNFLLQNMDSPTQAGIEAVLAAEFASRAAKINFTPISLTIRALPWIEAGDALQITTEDGVVVDTYAMNHTIAGIQALFDDIESRGGEIIGEV